MLFGLRELDDAAEACGGKFQNHEALRTVLDALGNASAMYDYWPERLQRRADEIRRIVGPHGVAGPAVERLGESDREELGQKLSMFVAEACGVAGE